MLNAIERTLKVPCDQYIFPTLEEMNVRREEEFFAKIEEGLKGDLGDYRKALQRMIEESGHDTLEIAASLAFLEAGKKGLRYEDMPAPPRKQKRDRDDRSDRSSRHNDRGDRRDRGDRGDRRFSKDDHLQSYRLEVGEYHGTQKGDIVGAIANEVGLDPKNMGKIRMFKDHTFIDLPKDMPREIFEALKTVWVQGHQLNISVDKGRPRPDGNKGGKFSKGKGFDKRKKFDKGGRGHKGGNKGYNPDKFRS